MNAKEIYFAGKARDKVMDGIDKIANAVRVTLGPKGRTVILDKYYSGPRNTKDGVSVAKEIFLKDRFENVGAQLVKQVSMKAADMAGDGTTTAAVLAQAIAREGIKAVALGVNPMDLKRGIDLAISEVVKHLKEHSKPIDNDQEILQIATISANGDKDIGNMITEAFTKVGKEGFVNILEGRKLTTDLEFVDGITFNNGYLSPYFAKDGSFQDNKNMECVLDNPIIFFYEQEFRTSEHMETLLKTAHSTGRPLLIIAHDVIGGAIALMVANVNAKRYQSCAVKAPSFGEYRNQLFEDMAIITGGTLIPIEEGSRIVNKLKPETFGRAKKAIISRDKTIIIDGEGNQAAIIERIQMVQGLLKDLDSQHEVNEEYRQHLKDRLANLKGMAIIRVGGSTELEMKERYDRYEDALCATKAALLEGILPGGGVALLKSAAALDQLTVDNDDMMAGVKILQKALFAPCAQIADNAGVSGVVEKLIGTDYNYGYDAQKGIYGNMIDAGIIDPTKVVRCALEGAGSIASIMLTTEAVITDLDDPSPAIPQTFAMPIG